MRAAKVILLIFSLLVMPSIVNAQCSYDEKYRLQSIASNLNFSYNYKETDEGINSKVNFSITIANLHPDIYIVDQTNVKVYYYNNTKEVTINNYKPGSSIQFVMYANTNNCKNVELMTNYIALPSYNRFYKDPICDGVTGYKLCNRWSLVNMTYDKFVKKVEGYKASQKVGVPTVEKEKDLIEIIIDFLANYSYYVFGGIVIVCGLLIYYLRRKDDFDLS